MGYLGDGWCGLHLDDDKRPRHTHWSFLLLLLAHWLFIFILPSHWPLFRLDNTITVPYAAALSPLLLGTLVVAAAVTLHLVSLWKEGKRLQAAGRKPYPSSTLRVT